MKLKPEQINQFIEVHKDFVGFDGYSEEEISVIANGVANYYVSLYEIYQKNLKKSKETDNLPDR